VLTLPGDEVANSVKNAAAVYQNAGLQIPGTSEVDRTYIKAVRLIVSDIGKVIPKHWNDLSPIVLDSLSDAVLQKAGFVPTEQILSGLTGKAKQYVQMYARIGWEAGRTIAGLHRSGFLWGTFCDHSFESAHSNAHTDNCIVLGPPAAPSGSYQILALVDCDMSFAKEQAVNVWLEPPAQEDDMVTTQFPSEFKNFMRDLGGLPAAEPELSALNRVRVQPEGDFGTLTWIGRDLAIWEYIHAYQAPLVDRSGVIGLEAPQAFEIVENALRFTVEDNC
jgi:hypothetical protein